MGNKVKTTIVFEHILEAERQGKKLVVAQGGSRSGKTVNILIYWIQKLLQEPNKTLSIFRKTLPSLKNSVLKDLVDVLEMFDIYDHSKWHKQEGWYELPNGSIINWGSCDEPQKLRGSKRDYLYCNEANELSLEDWRQLIMRTEGMVALDLNPSEISCWVYELEQRDDCYYFKTTWRDNPFIPQSLIDEIERLRETDENYYRIYSLGERGIPTTLVFNKWNMTDEVPRDCKLLGRGMDFGFNAATTLIEVYQRNDELYLNELMYVRNLTMGDIIYRMNELKVEKTDAIWCDSALPQNIEDLKKNGRYNAKPVDKKSILSGIDKIKRHKVFITNNSPNILKEFQSYKWKVDKDGKLLDSPVDDMNHTIDAVRYVLESTLNKRQGNYRVL
jgi:phage terminase large subunit